MDCPRWPANYLLFALLGPQTRGSPSQCYILCAVLMDNSSISEQVKQSPEADSKSELAVFSLNSSQVSSLLLWSVLSLLMYSSALLEAHTPLSGTYSGVSGGSRSPCGVPDPLLTSASVVLTWTLFPGQSLRVPLGEQFHFVCWGSMRNPGSEHPTGGVPMMGMFYRWRIGSCGFLVWHAGLLIETQACGPHESGGVAAIDSASLK